jgi:hypothetical protein
MPAGFRWAGFGLGLALPLCPSRSGVSVGFNHVVVAVRNLDSAVAGYGRLGFAVKPGRPHDDGIRNAHVKFRSGTEIELSTVGEPTDEWTGYYRARIEAGDGPAALAFYPHDLAGAGALLARAGLRVDRQSRPLGFSPPDPLRYVFFVPLNFSPTDRPEHFAHRNRADSVVAVWIAADSAGSEERLLRAFGSASCGTRRIAALDEIATVYPLADADALVLPWRSGASRRGVIGLTLHVSSLRRASSALKSSGAVGASRSLWISPSSANGLWLELTEASP